MIRIGIAGACGKMGRRIGSLCLKDSEVELSAAVEIESSPELGKDFGEVLGGDKAGLLVTSDLEGALSGVDCLIDFTLPEATLGNLASCSNNKVPMVIGTTGMGEEGEEKIKETSKKIPIVFSPNMAIGVNVVFKIVAEAARALGKDFKIKVDETHHVHKKDSPSGTAKMIAKVIKDSSGEEPEVEAFREGEVIGNHGIVFDSEFENIEIRHDAKTRDVFAAGAIEAAKFTAGKPAGLYSMKDVLGL